MLAGQLQMPLSVTPRIYADEIAAEGETYLSDFTARLAPGDGLDLRQSYCCPAH